MEYTSSSCVWKNQIAYILCVSRRVHWYALPPCTLWKALASDTNPVPPSSGILRPLRSFRHWGNSPQPTVPQNHASPLVAPRKPRVAGFHPRWGTTRPARTEAGSGHTGPSLAERKENDPARKAVASADGAYASVRLPIKHMVSPKTSSGERCEKQAGERPGVAHRRPVPGHFARQSRSLRDFS